MVSLAYYNILTPDCWQSNVYLSIIFPLSIQINTDMHLHSQGILKLDYNTQIKEKLSVTCKHAHSTIKSFINNM